MLMSNLNPIGVQREPPYTHPNNPVDKLSTRLLRQDLSYMLCTDFTSPIPIVVGRN